MEDGAPVGGTEVLQTDPKEVAYDPFNRVMTEDMIDLIAAALASIPEMGDRKKGKKTTLFRDTPIAQVKLLGGKHKLACVASMHASIA